MVAFHFLIWAKKKQNKKKKMTWKTILNWPCANYDMDKEMIYQDCFLWLKKNKKKTC